MSDDSRLHRFFGPAFNYANNPASIFGIVIATVSGLSIAAFLAMELAGSVRNPYVGIFAYFILPSILVAGLLLIPAGMALRRRRLVRRGVSEADRGRYPRLDFNDPRWRRLGIVVISLTAVNALIFGITSLMAVEHMESAEFCGTTCHNLMTPEYTSYQDSPHSRVACVECHIGPGASHFVRSKVDGLRQLWKTTRGTYERPVPTPVHNLRPASETCEHCHWPAKHYGDKIRTFARFDDDEANTPSYTVMVLPVGGGRRDLGRHGGIHWWHTGDNRIRYLSDGQRQEISWVELTTPGGEVRVYTRDGEQPPAEALAGARTMDCVDCHNRPTHLMAVPSAALDEALEARPEVAALPFYKRRASEAVASGYATHAEGVAAVREAMLGFYRESYPEIWSERRQAVESGADVAARVYARSFFPEMETDWQTHPNNIGHEDFPGCFRCHDEELATADGEHVISLDCESCHTFLVEGGEAPPDLGALF